MTNPFHLEILCGNCKEPIEFISQIESGFHSCWDMADEFTTDVGIDFCPSVKCPHCGEENWHFFLNKFYDVGKDHERKRIAERMKDFVLNS